MSDPTPLGYEAEATEVTAEVAAALDGFDDLAARYARATAAQAHHQAVVNALAAERARIAAELWAGGKGLSYAQIEKVLNLGSRARAQQLVERGRS